ncbi:MAG: putative PIN family toxin of toxin-antitoxin system [Candidatus Nitrosomirales archaeon]|jgi:putative PIN family toxin of toxin-antitoxin system
MLRAVVDTNVLVSALIGTGKPRELWKTAVERKFTIIISKEMLVEFLDVVERRKFVDIRRNSLERFVTQLIRISTMTSIKSSYRAVPEDPDDDIVINTAYDGNADYIVTGDFHLLRIGRFRDIKIISIDTFLKLF